MHNTWADSKSIQPICSPGLGQKRKHTQREREKQRSSHKQPKQIHGQPMEPLITAGVHNGASVGLILLEDTGSRGYRDGL